VNHIITFWPTNFFSSLLERYPTLTRDAARNWCGGLPAEVKRKLNQILLAMNTGPEGRKVLKVYNKVKKYDAFEGAARNGLETARKLTLWLKKRSGKCD